MKKIMLELDDATAARLDEVAPASSRKRSDFIRMALRKAFMDLEEERTAAAYARLPDDEPIYFDPEAWEVREPRSGDVARPKRSRRR